MYVLPMPWPAWGLESLPEPTGSRHPRRLPDVAGGRLQGIELDCNHIPDAAMTLATTALFAEGPTTLRNIASWRVKETDRIAAMATELRKLGAVVEQGSDFIRVLPPVGVQGLQPGRDRHLR
jgi:3-phosphoshikimate 1-carboxyvinyltransferase